MSSMYIKPDFTGMFLRQIFEKDHRAIYGMLRRLDGRKFRQKQKACGVGGSMLFSVAELVLPNGGQASTLRDIQAGSLR